MFAPPAAVMPVFFSAAAYPAPPVEVYLYWGQGCPHCERAIEFLKRLEAAEVRVRVHYLEIRRDAANRDAFIAGSALVYFFFLAAWLNFLLFVGAVVWVRSAVGVVALAGGCYYLREYFRNPEAACKVTAPEGRRRVFESLRRLATESRFWLALAGILALAFAVNLVELICSAGIPAVYPQVLALSNLPTWQYYGYLALCVLVFMLDDLFVFVVAMKTLQVVGATGRYTRFSNLAGGLVLLSLGALLILRPQWLTFG